MSDEFDYWLGTTFLRCQKDEVAGGWEVEVSRIALPRVLSAGQAWRAAVYLLRLSGHAPGTLPPGALEAIRARVARDVAHGRRPPPTSVTDVRALLAHADALAADLAAAEGALADLCSPQSGEANAAYLRGRDDGVRRCVTELGRWANDTLELCRQGNKYAGAISEALMKAASALESPPAPAAAPGGE